MLLRWIFWDTRNLAVSSTWQDTCLLPLFPSSDHCYVLPHSRNALHGCGKLLQDKPADGRAAFTWDHSRRVRTLATMIVLPVLARTGPPAMSAIRSLSG